MKTFLQQNIFTDQKHPCDKTFSTPLHITFSLYFCRPTQHW